MIVFVSGITASRGTERTFTLVIPIGIGEGGGRGERANAPSYLALEVFAVLSVMYARASV